MADLEIENKLGYTDKRGSIAANARDAGATNKQQSYHSPNTSSNMAGVGALRTRLTAINGTYYNSGRLNQMTKNDMMYALRLADEAAGI